MQNEHSRIEKLKQELKELEKEYEECEKDEQKAFRTDQANELHHETNVAHLKVVNVKRQIEELTKANKIK